MINRFNLILLMYNFNRESSRETKKEESNKTSQTHKWFGKGPSLSSSPKSLLSKTPEQTTSRSFSTPSSRLSVDEGSSSSQNSKVTPNSEKKSTPRVPTEGECADSKSNSSVTEQKDVCLGYCL